MFRLNLSAGRVVAAATRSHVSTTAAITQRHMSEMREVVHDNPPKELIDRLPDFPMTTTGGENFQYTTPVKSAHMIEGEKISSLDSVAVGPDGSVVHGRYGTLPEPAASSVPLEYLALLHPAAEATAAMRIVNAQADGKKGTVLVYGISQASGMAAAQLANSQGHAVVGVVTSHHSGNDDLCFAAKHMLDEPSLAVPQEYAVCKALFKDLVDCVVSGNEGYKTMEPEKYLDDFKDLFVKYSKHYPDTRPAAVSTDMTEWKEGFMEKDREMFDLNMQAYLSQFPPGAPPVDQAKLDSFFTIHQYEIFRQKFWKQTTALICDDDMGGNPPDFSPPHIVQDQIHNPEEPSKAQEMASGFPFQFSILNKQFPEEMNVAPGGPVVGALIQLTPELTKAIQAVAGAGSIRAKAEALQFLTGSEKMSFLTARAVIQNAGSAPVVVMGGKVAGFESASEPTDADVKQALEAMDFDDDGNSRINLFVQAYRASEFPFYADYAIHRANEVCAGPRNIVVLK